MSVHDDPAQADAAEPVHPPRTRSAAWWTGGESVGRLLLEAALIVLSVLLGFAVNAWQQRQSDRELSHRVLANFHREVEMNLRTVRRTQLIHKLLAERLKAAAERAHPDSSAFDVFVTQMPRDGLGMEPLQEAAWETAQSTAALRLLPYQTAAELSGTYVFQRTVSQTQRLFIDRFMSPANYDPAQQRTMLLTSHMLMVELSGQESYLIEDYRKMLRELSRPASR